MSNIPAELKYVESHEWLRKEEDGTITVGITDFAQAALGDVVFIELPDVGTEVEADEDIAVVESVKAASEIYVPVDGEVVEINETLNDDPSLINQDPENKAWMFKIKITDRSQLDALMDEKAYQDFIGG